MARQIIAGSSRVTGLLAIAVACCATPAFAGTLNLTSTTTNNGTLYTDNVTSVVNAGAQALAVPGLYGYANLFTAPLSNPVINPNGSSTGYNFYDDYVFTIAGAVADSITASIDLGKLFNISNLNERLYAYSGTAPVLGSAPANLIQAWTYLPPTGGVVDVIQAAGLTAGTYVLEIRGNVTGTFGGSYVGALNLQPVPLPAGLPLLLSALGMLLAVVRFGGAGSATPLRAA